MARVIAKNYRANPMANEFGNSNVLHHSFVVEAGHASGDQVEISYLPPNITVLQVTLCSDGSPTGLTASLGYSDKHAGSAVADDLTAFGSAQAAGTAGRFPQLDELPVRLTVGADKYMTKGQLVATLGGTVTPGEGFDVIVEYLFHGAA